MPLCDSLWGVTAVHRKNQLLNSSMTDQKCYAIISCLRGNILIRTKLLCLAASFFCATAAFARAEMPRADFTEDKDGENALDLEDGVYLCCGTARSRTR